MKTYQKRFVGTAILTLLGLLALGPVLPDLPTSSMRSEQFWSHKIQPEARFDVVVIGDSRIYRGIDPETLEQAMRQKDSLRVFNFGFSSAGLDSSFIQAGAALLDPASTQPTILLGVSPSTLADENMVNTHYHQEANRTTLSIWQRKHLNPKLSYFDPSSPELIRNAYLNKKEGYFQDYRLNGWIASEKYPKDVWKDFWMVEQGYHNARFSLQYQTNLIKQVTAWTAAGIEVFAFRPPAVEHVEGVENKAPINRPALIAQLEAAGATWITIPDRYSYETYDGNHLEQRSAERLSEVLGNAIKQTRQIKKHSVYQQSFEGAIESPWLPVPTNLLQDSLSHQGKKGQYLPAQGFSCTYYEELSPSLPQNLYLNAAAWVYNPIGNAAASILMVITIEKAGLKSIWKGSKLLDAYLNPKAWNSLQTRVAIPPAYAGAIVKAYVWNNSSVGVWIDDLNCVKLSTPTKSE